MMQPPQVQQPQQPQEDSRAESPQPPPASSSSPSQLCSGKPARSSKISFSVDALLSGASTRSPRRAASPLLEGGKRYRDLVIEHHQQQLARLGMAAAAAAASGRPGGLLVPKDFSRSTGEPPEEQPDSPQEDSGAEDDELNVMDSDEEHERQQQLGDKPGPGNSVVVAPQPIHPGQRPPAGAGGAAYGPGYGFPHSLAGFAWLPPPPHPHGHLYNPHGSPTSPNGESLHYVSYSGRGGPRRRKRALDIVAALIDRPNPSRARFSRPFFFFIILLFFVVFFYVA